jgi:hypothetical protein
MGRPPWSSSQKTGLVARRQESGVRSQWKNIVGYCSRLIEKPLKKPIKLFFFIIQDIKRCATIKRKALKPCRINMDTKTSLYLIIQ